MYFIQSELLLILLTIFNMVGASAPYACISFSGILLILYCMQSVWLEKERYFNIIRFPLTIGFCVSGSSFLAALLFYECRVFSQRWVTITLPAIMCLLLETIQKTGNFAEILLKTGILLILSLTLYGLENLMEHYRTIQKSAGNAVRVTALNALYEKKLNQELTVKNYLSDRNARLEERENISRNIHNSVGHSITAAIMTLEAADMLFDVAPDQAREKMHTANKRIQESLQTIRRAVRVLDTENSCVTLEDFEKACSSIIENFTLDTAICVKTDFVHSGLHSDIPHEHAEFLTGALQELLSNGLRHGKADAFLVRINGDSGHILLQVQDNGISDFSDQIQEERIQNGFGLKKLISYTERCGGTLRISYETGFKVTITLPLYHGEES